MFINIRLYLLICIISLLHSANPRTTSNYPVATTETNSYGRNLGDDDMRETGRGMMDYDHEEMKEIPEMSEMPEQKAIKNDPWAGYYDFIINEGSFKFWAAFQLATAVLLIYSACAAIYYAKFNVLTTDYDYYDDFFFGRSNTASPTSSSSWYTIGSQTFQNILNAISSKKYS